MFSLIMIALCGVVVGFGLRRWRALQNVNHTITITICFMLFVLGLSVGENKMIIQHLGNYGIQALLISVASMLGSAIGGWALYKYVFQRERKEGTA